jgi:hypothetical protein
MAAPTAFGWLSANAREVMPERIRDQTRFDFVMGFVEEQRPMKSGLAALPVQGAVT